LKPQIPAPSVRHCGYHIQRNLLPPFSGYKNAWHHSSDAHNLNIYNCEKYFYN